MLYFIANYSKSNIKYFYTGQGYIFFLLLTFVPFYNNNKTYIMYQFYIENKNSNNDVIYFSQFNFIDWII